MDGHGIYIDADKVALAQDEGLWEIKTLHESPVVPVGSQGEQDFSRPILLLQFREDAVDRPRISNHLMQSLLVHGGAIPE